MGGLLKKENESSLTIAEKEILRELKKEFFVVIPPIVIRSTKGINPQEIQKIINFYPPINPDYASSSFWDIEYVFDVKKMDFATGRPDISNEFSGHEMLSELLEDAFGEYNRHSGKSYKNLVGGHLYRDSEGQIILNEYSGHFGKNWNEEARKLIVQFLESQTGMKVIHKKHPLK
ncbi:MAG: hypothetical protein EAZ55_01140 [Cytophagales bacterium]|nr:MAG: hypothetical protein EAZ55_01140 [Cytophagales bacterium]